ncbi:MAG: Uma2 family endonuclease [Methylococcales bacterium]
MSTGASATYASLSVDDYLRKEQQSDIRHEYIGGEIYAMAGASAAHNLITGNLFAGLHQHLAGGPCQVFVSDMKLRLGIAEETIFYYPDIMVCREAADRKRYFREEPKIIVEVLSESTVRIDRREKLLAYRRILSLHEYVLVEQDCTKATLFRRAGEWKPVLLQAGDELQLQSVDFSMTVNALYAGVEIEH